MLEVSKFYRRFYGATITGDASWPRHSKYTKYFSKLYDIDGFFCKKLGFLYLVSN
jgi:hypothetical protein